MNTSNIKKLSMAGIFIALAVVGSFFSFPVFGSKCAPVQHMINVLCAVLLGPTYGIAVAFGAALIRNLMGLGTLMAFPGGMVGAFLSAILYRRFKNILSAIIGEVFGTAFLGGLLAYPVAVFLMGVDGGTVAFYAYIIPFLISTGVGAAISGIILYAMEKGHVLKPVMKRIE